MNKLTIKQAIIKTMEKEGKPLTSQEVYNSIVKHNLYTFGAKDPKAVVNSEIRQHCEGLDLKNIQTRKNYSSLKKMENTVYYLDDKRETNMKVEIHQIAEEKQRGLQNDLENKIDKYALHISG